MPTNSVERLSKPWLELPEYLGHKLREGADLIVGKVETAVVVEEAK